MTELMKYSLATYKDDPETMVAVEAAYKKGILQERERQIAISRTGSEEALLAANMLTAALVKARENR